LVLFTRLFTRTDKTSVERQKETKTKKEREKKERKKERVKPGQCDRPPF
jgi:hypothetical protein